MTFEKRDWWLPRLKSDPLMDSLRGDPRFDMLLGKIGLPPNESKPTNEKFEAETVMQMSEPPAVAGGLTESSQDPDEDFMAATADVQPSDTANGPDLSSKPKPKWWLFGLLGLPKPLRLVCIGQLTCAPWESKYLKTFNQ